MAQPYNIALEKAATVSAARPGAVVWIFFDPEIKGHPICLAISDKNHGVGYCTRLVATILASHSDYKIIKILANLGMTPNNAPRKVVLTGLSETGVGELTLSVFSEHADNALSMGGPLCPIPTASILHNSREALLNLLDSYNIPTSIQTTGGTMCQDDANSGLKPSRHTSGVFLPSVDDFALVGQVVDHIRSMKIGRSRRAMALLLELTAGGIVPLENLTRHSTYYTLHDFCFANNDPFFMCLLPQKAGGLGIIPMHVRDQVDLISKLLKTGFADYRSRERLLVPAMLSALRNLLPSLKVTMSKFLAALKRVSYYRCHYHFSGFVAAGLTGKLQIPANYIAENDLFVSMGYKGILGLDGKAWVSPHLASDWWSKVHEDLSLASLKAISKGEYEVRTGSRGPSVKLPKELHVSPTLWTTFQWCTFARLFGPTPRSKTVRKWIGQVREDSGGSKKNTQLAQGIMTMLRRIGAIQLDRPARIIPPLQFVNFMTALVADLKTKYVGKRGKRLAVGVLLAAVIGARPMELYRLKGDDVRLRGKLLWVRIRGVKKTMRSQRDAIGNLVLTEIRQILFDMLCRELRELSPLLKARVCDYDSYSLRQFRDTINAAVQRVAERLLGGSEGFRFYSLRRECAILALNGLLEVASSANYYDLLGTLARNGGHSLPEFLGGYIGTSVSRISTSASVFGFRWETKLSG